MKKSLACALALSALGLAAPMRADTVFIPVVEPVNAAGAPLATQLWISNFDGVERPYATAFFQADRAGAAPKAAASSTVPADRAVYLEKVAAVGETGLLAVDASPELAISAWIKSTHGKRVFYAGLPVITAENQLAAGTATYLNGVGRDGSRDVTQLALVNLGETAAQCQVDVVALDGSLVRNAGSVEVAAKSMSRFEDALGLRGEAATTARVACDQPFYALAAMVDSKTSEVSFVNPADAIEKVQARKASATTNPVITFSQSGNFHLATKTDPKKILRIPVPKQLNASRVSAEFDVVAGPWNPRLKKGAHNLIFFHRGRFRSNTLANVNAFGPNNNNFKSAQNLDLPARYSTSAKVGFAFQQGQTYHVSILYSAADNKVTYGIYQNGSLVKGGQYDGSARNRLITVPGTGLVAEFGNYNNQELPEVSSLGWRFANFHVEIVQQPNI
jgi:hypothetical protein